MPSTAIPFKARARRLLKSAAPYCTPGEGFDRRIRDQVSTVRRAIEVATLPPTILRALDELEFTLALARSTSVEERARLCKAYLART